MGTNYVLIDFESVQPETLAPLEAGQYHVIVFVGPKQNKLPFELVSAVQRMGDKARYVRLSGAGPNALDFHIAFYIGELAAKNPGAAFHIISKDTGFDPLIKHLKARQISAARVPSLDKLPKIKAAPKQAGAAMPTPAKVTPKQPAPKKAAPAKAAPRTPAQERAHAIAEAIRQPKSTKPRTHETLRHHIAAHFQKHKLTPAEVEAIVAAMKAAGHIKIVGGKVTYSLVT